MFPGFFLRLVLSFGVLFRLLFSLRLFCWLFWLWRTNVFSTIKIFFTTFLASCHAYSPPFNAKTLNLMIY